MTSKGEAYRMLAQAIELLEAEMPVEVEESGVDRRSRALDEQTPNPIKAMFGSPEKESMYIMMVARIEDGEKAEHPDDMDRDGVDVEIGMGVDPEEAAEDG